MALPNKVLPGFSAATVRHLGSIELPRHPAAVWVSCQGI